MLMLVFLTLWTVFWVRYVVSDRFRLCVNIYARKKWNKFKKWISGKEIVASDCCDECLDNLYRWMYDGCEEEHDDDDEDDEDDAEDDDYDEEEEDEDE